MTCVGTPVSWLRLETFALDGRDASVRDHLAECPACARCLEDIRGSDIELPRLVVPEKPTRKQRWLWWLAPAMAAAIVLLVIIRRSPTVPQENTVTVKGVGEVVIGVVRERAGVIRDDVLAYRPGDRFKVVVTCPPEANIGVEVTVEDAGQIDRPLAPAQIACGNQVAIPGAFTITGDRPNQVCVHVGGERACVTLVRE
jgi:hypothetical protein